MTTFIRDCFSCRFADIASGKRTVHTENGDIIVQDGGRSIVCTTSPKNLKFNMNNDTMECGSWEPKDGCHWESIKG